jgi:WD40 repeat protein
MLCVLELGLLVFGIVLLFKGELNFSTRRVGAGAARLIGAILLLPLPAAILVGFVDGVMHAAEHRPYNAQDRAVFYAIVELALVGGCALLAVLIGAMNLEDVPRRRRLFEEEDGAPAPVVLSAEPVVSAEPLTVEAPTAEPAAPWTAIEAAPVSERPPPPVPAILTLPPASLPAAGTHRGRGALYLMAVVCFLCLAAGIAGVAFGVFKWNQGDPTGRTIPGDVRNELNVARGKADQYLREANSAAEEGERLRTELGQTKSELLQKTQNLQVAEEARRKIAADLVRSEQRVEEITQAERKKAQDAIAATKARAAGQDYRLQLFEAKHLLERGKPAEALNRLKEMKSIVSPGLELTLLQRLCEAQALDFPNARRIGVASVRFSADSRYLAFGSAAGVAVRDLGTGATVRDLAEPGMLLVDFDFSTDGKHVFFAAMQSLGSWNLATGAKDFDIPIGGGSARHVRAHPDGKRVVYTVRPNAGPQEARCLDATTQKDSWKVDVKNPIYGIALSPDGKRLAILHGSGAASGVIIIDPENGNEIRKMPAIGLYLAFNPDSKRLVVQQAKSIVVLDVESGKELLNVKPTVVILSDMVFSPDGDSLLGFADKSIISWSAMDGSEQRRTPITSKAYRFALSPDGSALGLGVEGGTVRVLGLRASTEGRPLITPARNALAVALSAADDLLAVGHEDGTVTVGDPRSGQVVITLPKQDRPVVSLAFHPQWKELVTASADPKDVARPGVIKVWNIGPTAAREVEVLSGLAGPPSQVVFSEKGNYIACVARQGENATQVVFWKRTNGQVARTAELPGTPAGIAFHPDETGAYVICRGSPVVNFVPVNGGAIKPVHRAPVRDLTSVAAGPEEKIAVGGADGRVYLWNRWLQCHEFRPGHRGAVTALFIGTDRRLVTAGADGIVKVWDIAEAEELLALGGPTGGVTGLALTPGRNGRFVAIGKGAAGTGEIRVWNAAAPAP